MNNVAGISRRNLFKAAGVTAIAAAAAGTLTGCGKGYVNDAEDKNLTTQAPAGPSWLGSAPEIAESDITETIRHRSRRGGVPHGQSVRSHLCGRKRRQSTRHRADERHSYAARGLGRE